MAQTVDLFETPLLEQESAEEINAYQLTELKKLLVYLSENSTFYKNHFAQHNINISAINSPEDLAQIPPIGKEELERFNVDFVCVPRTKIIDYVTTSGTSGKPVNVVLSEKDLERLAYNEAISLACANGSPNDVYQLTTTIDRRFMAGLAYFMGIRKLGNGVVRVGSGLPQLQLDTIDRVQPNTLIAVPSFVASLIDYAKSVSYDLNKSSVKKIVCIGEGVRDENLQPNALHKKITDHWNVQLFSTYASTEMGTAYTECGAQQGGHEHPELIISELLDDNGKVITDKNAYGELCITTLGVEGMPLLRFRTGDIVKFYHEKCACGRTTKRISPVLGRKNQMIKYKGTTLYPPAIFEILNNFSEVQSYVAELKHSDVDTDDLIIYLSANTQNANILLEQINEMLRAKLRVKPKVFMISSKEIFAMQKREELRKPLLFIDSRK